MRAATIAGLLAIALAAGSAFAGAIPADSIPTILVSRQLREAQGLAIGDIVSLSSDPTGAHPQPFRIAGSYEPMPNPMLLGASRHEVRLHLPDLMTLTSDETNPLASESVDAINVAVPAPTDAGALAQRLASRIPGLVVRSTSANDDRAAPFVVLERFHLAIAIVTVIASSIFLLALMLMLVDERRETVGILRLIGVRRRRILLHVLAEGVVVAAAGALFGIVLSVAFEGGINRFFQWRYDTSLVFVRITPAIALRSITFAVPLGVAATFASSWTLLRREMFLLIRR
ncbi:MAG TPA: ABC transporter permease [Vicinamibacterales bacterium]